MIPSNFVFLNATPTTDIYTLSLHDALPICCSPHSRGLASLASVCTSCRCRSRSTGTGTRCRRDRKSTRLNSSHSQISYAVFCLKKKNFHQIRQLDATPCHESVLESVSSHDY